ncbi:hypothetical protein FV767_24125 [Vibrio parahaemolyticus]|nr:hypothetical protein [Vibrio parahaemolyticus]
MKFYEDIKQKYKKQKEEYEPIIKEIQIFAYERIRSMIYLCTLAILFGFYKFQFFGESNARNTINILFDWSLVSFTFFYLIALSIPYFLMYKIDCLKNSLPTFYKGFKWAVTTTFDFLISLIFVAIAGVAMKTMDIPLVDEGNPFVFVTLFCSLTFSIIIIGIACFVESGTPKKREALITLGVFVLIFLSSLIYYSNK